ncbi:hypothetical protein MNBD_PLANCTO02-1525, partial [hydrothermal vent metagenome]
GHKPSVVSDHKLWSLVRANIYEETGKTVVLLGASRIHIGFNTDEFRSRFPDYRLSQLAVSGNSPLATLRDLAEDSQFKGTIICSVTYAMLRSDNWSAQQPFVEHFHHQTGLNSRLERKIANAVQQRLALKNSRIRLTVVAKHLLIHQKFPKPFYLRSLPDRSRIADYSSSSKKQLQHRINKRLRSLVPSPYCSPDIWLQEAMSVEQYVRKIQSRGGKVIFVRMPVSNQWWELNEEVAPRVSYWDQFAEKTSAITVHYQDYELMKKLYCPDHSHLSRQSAKIFTHLLLDELEKRKILSSLNNN